MDSACVSTTILISGFSALVSLYCLHVQLGNKKTLLARKQQASHRNIVKYRSIFELPAYKFHSPSVGIKISWYCDRWVGLRWKPISTTAVICCLVVFYGCPRKDQIDEHIVNGLNIDNGCFQSPGCDSVCRSERTNCCCVHGQHSYLQIPK